MNAPETVIHGPLHAIAAWFVTVPWRLVDAMDEHGREAYARVWVVNNRITRLEVDDQ